MLRKLFHGLRARLRRGNIEREMDRELRFHLEMETAENIRQGMGGVARMSEAYRDLSRFRLVEELWQDVRFSARLLLKQSGFLAVAVLTLALGIGANTAIFTVVNGVMIRSLPYCDPSQLGWSDGPGIKWEDPNSDECAWGRRNRVKSFQQVAIFGAHEGATTDAMERSDAKAGCDQSDPIRVLAHPAQHFSEALGSLTLMRKFAL
jgi:hypothetical protein